MLVTTTTKSNDTIDKPIVPGGGIIFRMPNTYYDVIAEVMSVDEENAVVTVKGRGFTGCVDLVDIKDAISPSDYAMHEQNVILDPSGAK